MALYNTARSDLTILELRLQQCQTEYIAAVAAATIARTTAQDLSGHTKRPTGGGASHHGTHVALFLKWCDFGSANGTEGEASMRAGGKYKTGENHIGIVIGSSKNKLKRWVYLIQFDTPQQHVRQMSSAELTQGKLNFARMSQSKDTKTTSETDNVGGNYEGGDNVCKRAPSETYIPESQPDNFDTLPQQVDLTKLVDAPPPPPAEPTPPANVLNSSQDVVLTNTKGNDTQPDKVPTPRQHAASTAVVDPPPTLPAEPTSPANVSNSSQEVTATNTEGNPLLRLEYPPPPPPAEPTNIEGNPHLRLEYPSPPRPAEPTPPANVSNSSQEVTATNTEGNLLLLLQNPPPAEQVDSTKLVDPPPPPLTEPSPPANVWNSSPEVDSTTAVDRPLVDGETTPESAEGDGATTSKSKKGILKRTHTTLRKGIGQLAVPLTQTYLHDAAASSFLPVHLSMKEVERNYHCLFKTLVLTMDGMSMSHWELRKRIVDYVVAHWQDPDPDFATLVGVEHETETVETYRERMLGKNKDWGAYPEILAAARMLGKHIVIFSYNTDMNIDESDDEDVEYVNGLTSLFISSGVTRKYQVADILHLLRIGDNHFHAVTNGGAISTTINACKQKHHPITYLISGPHL
jgi:hypothetical protein